MAKSSSARSTPEPTAAGAPPAVAPARKGTASAAPSDTAQAEIHDLARSLRQTADEAESLTASSQDIASSINELAASIEQVTGNSVQAATAATQTSAAIRQIDAGTQ